MCIRDRQDTIRKNNYDEASGRLTIEPVRAQAFEENLKHYTDVFTNGKTVYAVQRNAQADPAKLRQLNAFFFWTSWASATNRPNNTISYTSNFPSEPLVGNVPTSSAIVWTGVSVIMLLAGIGWLVWYYASRETESVSDNVPDDDPLIGAQISPSQKATVKYFLVVTLLFLLQIAMGMLTAHYGVEGGGFFGIPLADYLPYVVTRTWHTQLSRSHAVVSFANRNGNADCTLWRGRRRLLRNSAGRLSAICSHSNLAYTAVS